MTGPEFLTVFDGLTGKALATTDYISSRIPDNPKNLTPPATNSIRYGVHAPFHLDPDRPGLEAFSIQEWLRDAGLHMFDARTGEVLWKNSTAKPGEDGEGPARGLALDIDPRTRGFECSGAGASMWGKVFDSKGNLIETGGKAPSVNFGIYWDGDLLSELLNGTSITKWDWLKNVETPMLEAKTYNCVSNNWTKANPSLSADILGDWREEVIWRTEAGKEMRIFTTTIPTTHRFRTFMHDPVYRLGIA